MKVFWDTNLFIYLWEDSPRRPEMRDFSQAIIEGNHTVITSTLTLGEILVQPARKGNDGTWQSYVAAFQAIPVVSFDFHAAQCFAELRARHEALRAPDAIQLACAAVEKCDLFVTNDSRLSTLEIPGIKRIVALADWRENLKGDASKVDS